MSREICTQEALKNLPMKKDGTRAGLVPPPEVPDTVTPFFTQLRKTIKKGGPDLYERSGPSSLFLADQTSSTEAISCFVYSSRGAWMTCSTPPCSTTRPPRMTMTRSHMLRTTARSWETRITDMFLSRCS